MGMSIFQEIGRMGINILKEVGRMDMSVFQEEAMRAPAVRLQKFSVWRAAAVRDIPSAVYNTAPRAAPRAVL